MTDIQIVLDQLKDLERRHYEKVNELVDAFNLLSADKPCETPEKGELAERLYTAWMKDNQKIETCADYYIQFESLTSDLKDHYQAEAGEAQKWMREKIEECRLAIGCDRNWIYTHELLKQIGE